MSDALLSLANSPLTGRLVRALGLPSPVVLHRDNRPSSDQPLLGRTYRLHGLPQDAVRTQAVDALLTQMGAQTATPAPAVPSGPPAQSLIINALGPQGPDDLLSLRAALAEELNALQRCARLVVLGLVPGPGLSAAQAATAQGLTGLVRSLAKEIGRKGASINLIQVPTDLAGQTEPLRKALLGPLGFLASDRCSYVTGQVLRLRSTHGQDRPARSEGAHGPSLAGKTALITGAARGLGRAMAERLSRDGARVIRLDMPGAFTAASTQSTQSAQSPQSALADDLTITLDITSPTAPTELADRLAELGGLDILVHNAGITRDKTLARMREAQWQQVMAVNLQAILRIDAELDRQGLLHDQGREVCLSSISGLAGNRGQTNYATAKSALVAYVAHRAQTLEGRGITVNALAPGFIETEMTQKIPFLLREAGRRLNAFAQGGQPSDVAEALACLVQPNAQAISGQTLRVCGQALIGA